MEGAQTEKERLKGSGHFNLKRLKRKEGPNKTEEEMRPERQKDAKQAESGERNFHQMLLTASDETELQSRPQTNNAEVPGALSKARAREPPCCPSERGIRNSHSETALPGRIPLRAATEVNCH